MLLLFESSAGFCLFKVLNEGKLKEAETQDVWSDFETPEKAAKVVKLKAFSKFENTAEALQAAASLVDSKISKGLKKFLKKHAEGDTLAVLDAKLGSVIKEKLGINCLYSAGVMELTRGIRNQLTSLVAGLSQQDLRPTALGLSHSLSRYKLKFSPDKVDTMIVQAIGLLDDLDKELNTYAMRVREWYGWHFPEMTKIVADNIAYAKTVKLMGTRDKAADIDFSDFLEEEAESQLKEAAVILGAEKALFRALKTKHETPKYGLIYHASLIGQAPPKLKGKISRVLAAKCALGVRVDALGEVSDEGAVGLEARAKVEARLRQLEGKQVGGEAAKPRGLPGAEKYDAGRATGAAGGALLGQAKAYNADADVAMADGEKKKEKKKKKKDKEAAAEEPAAAAAAADEANGDKKEKKKKQKKRAAEEEAAADGAAAEGEKKKKKKKKAEA